MNNLVKPILSNSELCDLMCCLTFFYRFLRKGEAGGFKADMTQELIERFDKWNDELLKGTGFQFAM